MNRRKWSVYAVIGLATLMATSAVLANGVPGIDWWVIASGGAPSSGDSISLNGTLGQPVVGLSQANDVDLSAGYWVEWMGYRIYLPVVMR